MAGAGSDWRQQQQPPAPQQQGAAAAAPQHVTQYVAERCSNALTVEQQGLLVSKPRRRSLLRLLPPCCVRRLPRGSVLFRSSGVHQLDAYQARPQLPAAAAAAVHAAGRPHTYTVALPADNVGFRLLSKAGWREGTGLGASEQVRVQVSRVAGGRLARLARLAA